MIFTLNEEGYDSTNLLVPDECWNSFTPTMRQFWEIKQDNFEKILFFRLGKFYEVFFMDAIIVNKIFDIKFMATCAGKFDPYKLHCGINSAVIEKYIGGLVN